MVSDEDTPKRPTVGGRLFKFILVVLFLCILVTLGFMIANKVSNKNNTASDKNAGPKVSVVTTTKRATSGCITQSFSLGSTSDCVSNIQTMVNYMESSGLTECPFTGGALLAVNGTYDQPTVDQVKVIQAWENCYSKQEGSPTNLAVNGTMSSSTWDELCTYSYHYPQSGNSGVSIYRQASITAGNQSGCAQLF